MLIITSLPVCIVNAQEAVDLIHNANGTIKEGVYVSNFGGQFAAGYVLDRAFNNSTADSWCSAWSPGGVAYLQVNFPVSQQITEIKISGATSADYRVNFDVYVSNDINFDDKVKVHSQTTSYTSSSFITIDMSEHTTPYRYVKVITTSAGKRFGVGEIDVYGYAEELPNVSGDAQLAERSDVLATASDEYDESHVAQNAIDGNEDTAFFTSGGENPYFQLDLRRKSAISKIEFKCPSAGYEGTRKNFDVLLSNDPNFGNSVLVYKRLNALTAVNEWVNAYGIEGEEYRYIRIQAHSGNTQVGISEIKVWGMETESNLVVTDLALLSEVTATTEGTPATNTVDGDLSSYWLCWEETGKASVTYAFNEPEIVTSIALFPMYDKGDDSKRKGFNIYASMDGSFEDSDLIATVDEAIDNGRFTVFGIDEIKEYKAIKVESTTDPTDKMGFGFNEIKILYSSSDTKVEVVSTIPSDGINGITNLEGKDNFIEVELNRNINEDTINPDNVIITAEDGTTLSDWKPYSVEGKIFKIDVSILESNTTYNVTLTTDVKTGSLPLTEEYTFSFKTGAIFKAPYTPGKVIKNIAIGKTITGNPHASSGPLSRMIDGNETNYALTSGAPKIQVDLGNQYKVVAFELTPQSNPENTTLLQNLNILGSDTAFNFSDLTATKVEQLMLASYPATSSVKETIVLSEPKEARYIGLYRASTYMVLCELKIYALVDVDFGTWSVKTGGSEVTEITGAGDYAFSIPVTNYENSSDYCMILSSYDDKGALLNIKCADVSALEDVKTTLEATINVANEAVKVQAMLINNREDKKFVADTKTITKESYKNGEGTVALKPADKLSEALIFKTSDSGFTLNVASMETGALTPSDRIGVFVLKPGNSFSDTLSNSQFDSALCYAQGTGQIKAGSAELFTFAVNEKTPYGKYNILVSATRKDGATDEVLYKFIHIDPTELAACIDEFKNFSVTDDMNLLLAKYIDEMEFIRLEQIPEVKDGVGDTFEQLFIYFRDYYLEENDFTTVNDIVNCINGAYVLEAFGTGDVEKVKDALVKYSEVVKGIYDVEADTSKFVSVYSDLKDNIKDANSLRETLKMSCVLSYIQDGTRREVKEAIEKNADILGCDLDLAASLGVTLDEIVLKIDTKNASSYHDGSLGVLFKEIAEEIAKEKSHSNGSGSQSGGGSRPVSSGGNFTAGYIKQETPAKDDNITDNKDTEKLVNPFDDIENIDWAKDHILSLYEKGIIKGNGDGSFEPERFVTREEYLKMLVEALEINVVSTTVETFDDCNMDAWYYPYIQIAVSNKITKGVDRNNFGIGQIIKRQDMAVLTEKALSIKNISAQEAKTEFTDADEIAKYAKSSVNKMSALGFINGFEDGSFAPKNGTTRAQAAVIISRILDYLEEVAE